MTKLNRQILALLFTVFSSSLIYAQTDPATTDVLQGVNFDETSEAIQDVDVSIYLRDITADIESLDEKFTNDSLEKYDKYVAFRLEKIQQLVNKPAGDCMEKFDLIAYKGQIFSEISLKALNPFILDLRAMSKTKKDAKKALYDQMVLDANEAFANAIKSKEAAVTLKLAQTIVKAKQDSIFYMLSQFAIAEQQHISVIAALETQKNLKIRNSLEPVEATKAGRGAICYKIQIKKEPDPVPVTTVSTENEGTSTDDNLDGNNGNGNDSIEGTTTDGSTDGSNMDENGNPK
ncbi:MAG: hypothetical protein WCP57_02115 [Bacteroidota bacterium]